MTREFVNPECTFRTLDTFLPRRAIFNALKKQLPRFRGTLLDIGCGRMPYKSVVLSPPSRVERYLGLDLSSDRRHVAYANSPRPDLEWDGRKIPLESNSVDCAMATEVLQQCPDPEGVLRETARVLTPGGVLFFTTPFLWPVHDAPADLYRFTPFALERQIHAAGLRAIEMKTLGGWDASLAQMLGLWARRRPMGAAKHALISIAALPVVRWLAAIDHPQPAETDQAMFTGIAGTAVKPA